MAEVGFFRRVAPAVIIAAAGGLLLYLLPTSADSDSGAEDIGAGEEGFPSDAASTAPSDAATTAASGTAASSAGPAASASAAPKQRVIKGDAVNFRFGTVQVKVLLEGTTLVNIATLQAPGGGYQRYTDRAVPGMKAKILKAQSTQVSAVSGATYTSKAYAESVQSALDKA